MTGVTTSSRPIRSTPSPSLSAVILHTGGGVTLEHLLEGVVPEALEVGAEVVVVSSREKEATFMLTRFPGIRLVKARDGATIVELRVTGMKAAGGDIVTFASTEKPPPTDWLPRLASCGNVSPREPKLLP